MKIELFNIAKCYLTSLVIFIFYTSLCTAQPIIIRSKCEGQKEVKIRKGDKIYLKDTTKVLINSTTLDLDKVYIINGIDDDNLYLTHGLNKHIKKDRSSIQSIQRIELVVDKKSKNKLNLLIWLSIILLIIGLIWGYQQELGCLVFTVGLFMLLFGISGIKKLKKNKKENTAVYNLIDREIIFQNPTCKITFYNLP